VVFSRDRGTIGSSQMVALASVGSFAEIREAGRHPDGRYDLLAAATGRFTIESVDAGREPYIVAEVSRLDEAVGDGPRAERLAATAIRRFVRYLDLMRARSGESAESIDIRVEFDASDLPVEGWPDPAAAELSAVARLEPDDLPDDAAAVVSAVGDLAIPDDPTVLSYLLSGIVQVELPRRQALLEAATSEDRLEGLITLLERELVLLRRRLRVFTPDPLFLDGPHRS
jgi:Lon protease-like protein